MNRKCKWCPEQLTPDDENFCPDCSRVILKAFREHYYGVPQEFIGAWSGLDDEKLLSTCAQFEFKFTTPSHPGYDRMGSLCVCSWGARVHGNFCPEHGYFARLEVA